MEFAWLLPGFDIEAGLGGGTTDVVRGVIGRTNALAVGAYVKFLDPQRLGLEIIGNELARALELNAPEAYIVRVPEEVQLPGAAGRSEGFGTVDLEYETISRFMARSPDLRMYAPNLRNVLKGWAEVMVFDEWIGNGGRDFHDALVDEEKNVWVIRVFLAARRTTKVSTWASELKVRRASRKTGVTTSGGRPSLSAISRT